MTNDTNLVRADVNSDKLIKYNRRIKIFNKFAKPEKKKKKKSTGAIKYDSE